MRKIVVRLFAVVLIALICSQTQMDVFAAGNSKKNATEVFADNQINYGTISKGGTRDWYFITTSDEEAYYYFTVHNESGTENIHLIVYSTRDEQLLDVGYYTSAGTEITGSLKLLPNTQYYIRVGFNSTGVGNYYFKIDKNVDVVGNNKESATEMNINEKVESSIDGNGDRDYFVFTTADVMQEYKVSIENISGTTNAHVLIYTARDEQLLDVGYYTSAGSKQEELITLNPNSTYYAVVYLNDDGIGQYNISVTQCADGHTVSDTWETTKEPTCTVEGTKVKRCTVCKEVLETETVEAKGHTLGKWKITKQSTWTSLGVKEARCMFCGHIETGKDFSKIWIIPAIGFGAIIFIIGIINYIKSFRRSR